MNGDREAMLARVTEALRVPAPLHHEKPSKPAAHTVTAPFREWLPPVGATADERVALFARQSEVLRTEFCECADEAAAAAHLAAFAAENAWTRIALHTGRLTDAVAASLPGSLALLRIDGGYEKNALEACDAGLTEHRRLDHRRARDDAL